MQNRGGLGAAGASWLVDQPRYAAAERITLVCDNLNTHNLASLYQAFEPAEALRLAKKLELVHTPKHGSWLNVAESELSVLTRQCLDRRIASIETVADEAEAWGRIAIDVKSASTGSSRPPKLGRS